MPGLPRHRTRVVPHARATDSTPPPYHHWGSARHGHGIDDQDAYEVLNYELWAAGRMESAFAVGLVTTIIVIIAAIAARIFGARQEIH